VKSSKYSILKWFSFLTGIGGIVLLYILMINSQSFDSSGYGPGNLEAGIRAAQDHYEFRKTMENIYPILMTISVIVTIFSGLLISIGKTYNENKKDKRDFSNIKDENNVLKSHKFRDCSM
jgi:hypothetical protein